MTRRSFLAATSAAALTDANAAAPAVRLGLDLFSIRSLGWTPFEYLDYAAKWDVKVVHFSEIRFIGSLEDDHLRKVRAQADKHGIELEIGMASICPSSGRFDKKAGTAEQQLGRMIKAARIAGSPIVRCFLGSAEDRKGPIPIEGHIENTAKVIRNLRAQIQDAGIKVAVENHAGDMQARELKSLIEQAGKDICGACVDSGNPVWALEDPHLTLETLAPYAVTSHVRDSTVWKTPEGIAVQWVRSGEGNIGMERWIRRFAELCPGKALSLEVIVTPSPRIFKYVDPAFWDGYRNVPAWEFARFLHLAEKGQPHPPIPRASREQAPQREREDLEASLRWTKDLLSRI